MDFIKEFYSLSLSLSRLAFASMENKLTPAGMQ